MSLPDVSSQVFYMNYETRDDGKEHYNDIIAQYNVIHEDLYKNTSSKAFKDSDALEALCYYSAALIDTMKSWIRHSMRYTDSLWIIIKRQ